MYPAHMMSTSQKKNRKRCQNIAVFEWSWGECGIVTVLSSLLWSVDLGWYPTAFSNTWKWSLPKYPLRCASRLPSLEVKKYWKHICVNITWPKVYIFALIAISNAKKENSFLVQYVFFKFKILSTYRFKHFALYYVPGCFAFS